MVASLIPLSMLVAFIGMRAAGLSGNLMSLGAIDFGLVVDGAIIIVENAVRHLSERHAKEGRALTPKERDEVVLTSSLEVRSATAFGELIIALVYLPILTLEGVEGKMFRPMALTVVFALATAFVLSLTLTPVLASLLLPLRLEEKESWMVSAARRVYRPLLDRALRHRWVTVGVAVVALAVSVGVATTRGGEFIPELDEGAMALEVFRLPSTSLPEAARQTTDLERALRSFPEVETVICRTGRGEIAMDPMGVEMTDVLVMLAPRERWRFRRREDLVEAMERRIRSAVPGIVFGFSQPIKQRMAELIAGARGDVVVKLFGDDLDTLRESADAIARALRGVPGAEDVRAEQVSGLPMRRVAIDRRAAARYGVRVGDVLDTVNALGGITAGEVREGALSYAIQVRFDPTTRAAPEVLDNLPVATLDGRTVPLSQVASIENDPGPAQVSHEDVSRRVTIQANVRGRDLASFVAEARARVGREVRLPPGYRVEWGGQFEQLEAATERLAVVIPLALALIFVLLYTSFGAARPAAIIFLNVPFAATGGVLALAARGMPFSISAAVGFIALFGVAVLNGLVLVSTARHHEENGDDAERAVREGALVRMRPVLTTALVASLGFVPMALSEGAGAEVQRPLATVVIGGIVSSTLLTLLVLPVVYAWLGGRRATTELTHSEEPSL
jgi:cobalt-zinc-cadmium resistance protein CzcA